jgi:drug/metabolite transporter (DMT)-like permease
MSILLALVSALAFGGGMTLQQRGARTIPFEHALRASMLRRLLSRKVWLAGIAVSGVGFLAQLLALRTGALVVVQPIVTSALVVCLALTAWYDREPLGARTWAAVTAVVAGVAVFLWAGTAHQSATTALSSPALGVASAAFAVLTVLCARQARTGPGVARAIALGAAAGLGNAYVAVLARAGADTLRNGVVALARSPYPYALGAAAVVTVLLVQAIYQAGRPTLSLPIATMTEAVGSLVLAITVLHERPVLTGLRGGVAVVAFGLALLGLVDLSRDDGRAIAAPDEDLAPASTSRDT